MSSKSESATVVGYVVPGVQQLLGLKQIMHNSFVRLRQSQSRVQTNDLTIA